MTTVSIAREDLSFWADTPDARPCAPLSGDARAEIAIVGGGFAGLSAAYHLIRARPDMDIVLVESGCVGSGASGRNTGMLGPRVGGSIVDLCRRYGEAEARRVYHTSLQAVHEVKALIASEGIACELEETPQVKAALTERQAVALQAEAQTLERLGIAAPWYDANGMAHIAPVAYRAGLCYPHSALLNPVLLCRELKRIVMAAGVRVHERTHVRSLTPGHPVTIALGDGTLTARHVVLATNAYTAQLGLLQGQVIPIHTHVIQTERLSDAQLARLNWPRRTPFFEAGNIFNYFRLTRDNRILFGGGRPLYKAAAGDPRSGATDVADPRVWGAQAALFTKRFPALADVSISKRWSGAVGMTFDNLPVVGELTGAPGVFFAGGWNGHGVAMATASGATIAELVLGTGSARLNVPWVRGGAPAVPRDPMRAMGVSVYLTALEVKDRLDGLRERLRVSIPPRREVITWTSGR
jgi:gamma-glutamylputrescine oxidase